MDSWGKFPHSCYDKRSRGLQNWWDRVYIWHQFEPLVHWFVRFKNLFFKKYWWKHLFQPCDHKGSGWQQSEQETSRRCRNSSLHPALLVLVLMSVSKVHLYSQSTACQLAVEAFSFSSAVAACNTVYVGSTQFDRALENQYWVCSSLDSMRWKLPAMRKKDSRAIKSQALLHPGGLPGCTARSTLHGSSQQKLELDAFCQKNFLTKLLFSPAFHIMISLCIFDKNVQEQDPMCNCLPLMNVIC